MTDTQAKDLNGISPSVWQIFITFLKLGCTSFGGPIAHIAYFRKEFVEKRAWLNEHSFSQLLAICQFLPGPASSQLGFSIGLLKGNWAGAIAAFIAFTLPSVLLLLLFVSCLSFFDSANGQAIIHGLKLVACAVVTDALLGMYNKLCPDLLRKSLALFACLCVLLAGSSYSQFIAIGLTAVIGYYFISSTAQQGDSLPVRYSAKTGAKLLLGFFLLLILLPLFSGTETTGYEVTLLSLANAFYQAGALVFGGGHVVLPLLEANLVTSTQWVNETDFLAGYGASQAIPGPMFSFAAYLGAIIPSDGSSVFNALIATLFMFLPGFLLIAGILPFWKRISEKPSTFGAIAGVNAAVVGILAAALYDPIFTSGIGTSTDLAITLVAIALLRFAQVSPLIIVAWCTIASVFLI